MHIQVLEINGLRFVLCPPPASHRRHPVEALRHAIVFAGWKIGEAAASEGFLTAVELAEKALALGTE